MRGLTGFPGFMNSKENVGKTVIGGTVSEVVERAELHIISKCGHRIAEEQPAKVTQLIQNFVS